jgi:hypothetical protein
MPGLIEDDEQKKQPQIPPQVQMQLQQSGQMIDQLTQQLQIITEEIKTKKLELDSRERIEQSRLEWEKQKFDGQMELELAKIGSQEAVVQLREELNILRAQWQAKQQAEQWERETAAAEASQMRDQAHQAQQSDQAHAQGMQADQARAQQGMMADRARHDQGMEAEMYRADRADAAAAEDDEEPLAA